MVALTQNYLTNQEIKNLIQAGWSIEQIAQILKIDKNYIQRLLIIG